MPGSAANNALEELTVDERMDDVFSFELRIKRELLAVIDSAHDGQERREAIAKSTSIRPGVIISCTEEETAYKKLKAAIDSRATMDGSTWDLVEEYAKEYAHEQRRTESE